MESITFPEIASAIAEDLQDFKGSRAQMEARIFNTLSELKQKKTISQLRQMDRMEPRPSPFTGWVGVK